MRLTADLTTVKPFELLPEGLYVASISKKDFSLSKANNPMLTFTWVVQEGEFAGREIRYNTCVLSGVDKKGNEIVPIGLAHLLMATGVPFACLECGDGDKVQPIIIGDAENGFEKGMLFCQNGHALKIDFDDDLLVGARCIIKVGTQKSTKSDKVYNCVDGYLPE